MTRQPFHRSDFTGSAGPGLAKLRALNGPAEAIVPTPKGRKSAGLVALQAAIKNGEWEKAIIMAAHWPDLGDHAAAIQRGREAILRPEFMRQLKRDPVAMIEAAKAALLERWPLRPTPIGQP